jgi:Fic family protein
MKYNWQQNDWPNFSYNPTELDALILEFSEKIGRIGGLLDALPEGTQTDTLIDIMVSEAIKTSEIEGEYLSRPDVLSSIRNNLGLNKHLEQIKDQRASGIAELMICLRDEWEQPLNQAMLFNWHTLVMRGSLRVNAGAWRTHREVMQVISGPIGSETVHFEACPSSQVPSEMKRFIKWFNETAPGGSQEIRWTPVRAAISHVYFESIHPFEDGNGRIGRAVAEKALSQGIARPILLSLSQSIEQDRAGYYEALKQGQRSNEITPWIIWFTGTLVNAQKEVEEKIEFTLKKTRLFNRVQDQLNERQLKVLRRMLKEGPAGFKGGMTAKKYIVITGAAKATATRDLQELVRADVLIPSGGGRSVSYQVKL